MTIQEFLHAFANMPLERRHVAIDNIKHPGLTFYGVYEEVKRQNDKRMEHEANALTLIREVEHLLTPSKKI